MESSSRVEKTDSSNGRVEDREPSGHTSESDDLNYRVRCDYCGNALRRLARQGFLQTKVYSRFGYYPWECPLCREPVMVRQQHRYKKPSESQPEAATKKPSGVGAAGLEGIGPGVNGSAGARIVPTEFETAGAGVVGAVVAGSETVALNGTGSKGVALNGAKPKATRSKANGSNGAKPRSPRSRKAVSGANGLADSEDKTA
jgi:hypothetical protein